MLDQQKALVEIGCMYFRGRKPACRNTSVDFHKSMHGLRRMRDLGIGLAVANRGPENQTGESISIRTGSPGISIVS